MGTGSRLLTMLGFWLVTWPFRGVFNRFQVLWPLLIGASFGAFMAWRYSVAEQVPFGQDLGEFVAGGAIVLTVPYLLDRLVRRLFRRREAPSS